MASVFNGKTRFNTCSGLVPVMDAEATPPLVTVPIDSTLAGPAGPVAPAAPAAPVAPVGPCKPVAPTGPSRPLIVIHSLSI